MRWYAMSREAVLRELDTGVDGLAPEEAARRAAKGKRNALQQPKRKTLLGLFLSQFKNIMTVILLISALISGFFGQWMDMAIIFAVVLLNAVLGVVQESKAEKAIDSLAKLQAAKSKVKRGGSYRIIDSEELQPGDYVMLEAGDAVPTDIRIIKEARLKSDEAPLTGESVPVHKNTEILPDADAPVGDRKNMLFLGCSVTAGRGEGIVTAIGMDTEMGRIAGILNETKSEKTPLQRQLDKVGRVISVSVVVICLSVFIFNVIRFGAEKDNLINYFLLAVSLAVAAIPEGLNTCVTLVMAMGITRMSKRNAIVRHLPSIETLGCTEVICSDKTGTLTQNKMTVNREFCFCGDGVCRGESRVLLMLAAVLCNDTIEGGGKLCGDPTETALAAFARGGGLTKNEADKKYPRLSEIPFDSRRQLMTTVNDYGGRPFAFTKGAVDVLIEKCTHYMSDDGVKPLDGRAASEILRVNGAFARAGCRVLAFACREAAGSGVREEGLTFIGLLGMTDPVRPEVKDAVEKCKSAGIRPIMITGDHKDTAVAIGKELGIISRESEAITGKELDALTDAEFEKVIGRYSVYARVSPENKVRIVRAWKNRGKVCAMTGDGVNDAPALKVSDIGIGMGITGTDVTKNVADIVLADDNFATIVVAVEEGRKIYDNIRKSVQFMLSTNMSEVLTLMLASIFGLNMLNAVQILWINLVTVTIPAIGIGLEKGEKDIMRKAPRASGSNIFSGNTGFNILWQSLTMTLFVMCAFLIGSITGPAAATTMAFTTLGLSQIAHSFNMREYSGTVFKRATLENTTLFIGGLFVFALSIFIIYMPYVNSAFGLVPLSPENLAVTVILSFAIIPVVETVKLATRRERKGRGEAKRKAAKLPQSAA